MEWISVKDNPPPINKEVLTYNTHAKYENKVNAAYYDGEDFWYDRNSFLVKGVSHWMPLPNPPKTVQ